MSLPDSVLNWTSQTLGGRQFWGDVIHFRGWRIQQHIYTSHYRLLDPHDRRWAWGSRQTCEQALHDIKTERKLPPLSGKAVILIHGIVRSSKVFHQMQRELESAGYLVVAMDYPSTRIPITQSARYLEQVIQSLEGVEEINIVAHSLGGLVVRLWLQQNAASPDPRLHRLLLLGVPNQGARMANLMHANPVFQLIFGPAGQELMESTEGLIASLPTPTCEFADIAGARGTPDGFNPLISGDDDSVVSVESALLPGAIDSLTLPCLHSFLPSRPEVIAASLRFLQTGCLHESGLCTPVPRPESPTLERPAPEALTPETSVPESKPQA